MIKEYFYRQRMKKKGYSNLPKVSKEAILTYKTTTKSGKYMTDFQILKKLLRNYQIAESIVINDSGTEILRYGNLQLDLDITNNTIVSITNFKGKCDKKYHFNIELKESLIKVFEVE